MKNLEHLLTLFESAQADALTRSQSAGARHRELSDRCNALKEQLRDEQQRVFNGKNLLLSVRYLQALWHETVFDGGFQENEKQLHDAAEDLIRSSSLCPLFFSQRLQAVGSQLARGNLAAVSSLFDHYPKQVEAASRLAEELKASVAEAERGVEEAFLELASCTAEQHDLSVWLCCATLARELARKRRTTDEPVALKRRRVAAPPAAHAAPPRKEAAPASSMVMTPAGKTFSNAVIAAGFKAGLSKCSSRKPKKSEPGWYRHTCGLVWRRGTFCPFKRKCLWSGPVSPACATLECECPREQMTKREAIARGFVS